MSDREGVGEAADGTRRSRIFDYVETAAPAEQQRTTAEPAPQAPPEQPPHLADPPSTGGEAPPATSDETLVRRRRRRREAAALLGEFRRTAVLLPLDTDGSPLTADFGGIRWIYAFSDEAALARFAFARGEGSREWTYDRVLGARLLDVAIPAMPEPYGVALDAGSEGQGALFPPVMGIVPDTAAVDADETNGTDGNGELAR